MNAPFAALAFLIALSLPVPAGAQQPASPAPPYGPPIAFEAAKKLMAAAEAEAVRHNWPVVVTIVDSGGNMVMMQRLDHAQLSAIELSAGKALTAVKFKRPTKALEDAIAGGGAGLRLTALSGVTPIEGGFPILLDGRVVGAIGIAGVLAPQHDQVARAALDALGR
jgi:glc operon protein GlcG